MATVAPAADQTTELLQKLSLDSQAKSADGPDAAKKPSAAQFGSVVKADGANMPAPPNDRSATPIIPEYLDTNLCYPVNGYAPSAYYYGAYDGHGNEWEEYARYVSHEGMEMSPHGVYGDVFHSGYGYYGAYTPGSPVPTIGHDGQLYAHQPFQYPGAYYQASTPVTSQPPVKPAPQPDVSTSVSADQPTIPVDTKSLANGVAKTNGTNGALPVKVATKSSLTSNGMNNGRGGLPGGVHSGYQDPRYGYDGIRSPIPWMDGSVYTDPHRGPPTTSNISTTTSYTGNLSSNRNQNVRPLPHHMGLHPPSSGMAPGGGYANRMYSNNRMYGQCGTAYRTGQGFNPNGFDSRSNGRGWSPLDGKFNNKVRGRGNGFYGYGNENVEGLNELNRGPRSGRFKNNPKNLGPNVVLAVKGQSLPSFSPSDNSSLLPDRTQYNQEDFPVNYPNAKFYVIKSYSEDDVHKSVKYNVWASTPNGNKKLDDAFREAKEKHGSCPIFLFFSVNTSGQFVGVAEMVGPVDFNKTVEYWQQDKWNGCFSVKWHIVKDVPNSILKHIILENNENKPVTNSRDTQEIKLEQGIQMLKLFKEHISKTSILDDFGFYEGRQKSMQEKRTRQQFQKQVWDGKIAPSAEDKEKNAANTPLLKPVETTLTKENRSGELKQLQENGSAASDAPKVVKLSEKRILVKSVANGLPNGGVNGVANGIADVATKG